MWLSGHAALVQIQLTSGVKIFESTRNVNALEAYVKNDLSLLGL